MQLSLGVQRLFSWIRFTWIVYTPQILFECLVLDNIAMSLIVFSVISTLLLSSHWWTPRFSPTVRLWSTADIGMSRHFPLLTSPFYSHPSLFKCIVAFPRFFWISQSVASCISSTDSNTTIVKGLGFDRIIYSTVNKYVVIRQKAAAEGNS